MLTSPDSYSKPSDQSAMVFLYTGQEYRLQRIVNGVEGESFRVFEGKSRVITSQGVGRIRTLLAYPQ